MQVVAFATGLDLEWHWRIVNYAGEVVEESRQVFGTIHDAVAVGTQRLHEMDVVDRSVRPKVYGSTSHLRAH